MGKGLGLQESKETSETIDAGVAKKGEQSLYKQFRLLVSEMKYKEFVLDKFQEDAIAAVNNNHSVVVSAATGTGKTLIADYIIEKFIKEGKKVVYTAPIKALSNQKYRDFKEAYGDKVGILTGDVVINEHAPVLVMTTEVYRNMLLDYSIMKDLTYVIFDEIHFMNDRERGTVWEESIIFSPKTVRFLCLSATIPNAEKFAAWIESIKEHRVEVVWHKNRPVPLQKMIFFADDKKIIPIEEYRRPRKKQEKFKGKKKKSDSFLYLIDILREKQQMPAIFFSFSRKDCEEKAQRVAREHQFTSETQRGEIAALFSEIVSPQLRNLKSITEVYKHALRGVGIHHAGLLPKAKEFIEILFGKHLLSILFATETFAVGINMPARAVVFHSLRKYDGQGFRYLTSKEFHQVSGRAGRRGIDKIGYVYIIMEDFFYETEKVQEICLADSEDVVSQFRLSPNTVLNLINHYSEDEIETVLKSNFGYFMAKKSSEKQVRIMASYNNIKKRLIKYGYLIKDVLTAKGQFATRIYANEMLITELLFTGAFHKLNPVDINVLIGGVVYEPRRNDWFDVIRKNNIGVDMDDPIINKELPIQNIRKVDDVVRSWCSGCKFDALTKKCNLQEGDIVRFFRQIIDRLQQVKKAEPLLHDKFVECVRLIDRDVVQIEL